MRVNLKIVNRMVLGSIRGRNKYMKEIGKMGKCMALVVANG
jgi:hypothetical protein